MHAMSSKQPKIHARSVRISWHKTMVCWRMHCHQKHRNPCKECFASFESKDKFAQSCIQLRWLLWREHFVNALWRVGWFPQEASNHEHAISLSSIKQLQHFPWLQIRTVSTKSWYLSTTYKNDGASNVTPHSDWFDTNPLLAQVIYRTNLARHYSNEPLWFRLELPPLRSSSLLVAREHL